MLYIPIQMYEFGCKEKINLAVFLLDNITFNKIF